MVNIRRMLLRGRIMETAYFYIVPEIDGAVIGAWILVQAVDVLGAGPIISVRPVPALGLPALVPSLADI